MAVKSGTDLNCGEEYGEALVKAVEQGLITEDEIDVGGCQPGVTSASTQVINKKIKVKGKNFVIDSY